MKQQCREQWKQWSDQPEVARLGANKNPPMSSGGRQSQKSQTRIYAFVDLARESKQEKKITPVFPANQASARPQ